MGREKRVTGGRAGTEATPSPAPLTHLVPSSDKPDIKKEAASDNTNSTMIGSDGFSICGTKKVVA